MNTRIDLTAIPVRTEYYFLTDDKSKLKDMNKVSYGEAVTQVHKRQLAIIGHQKQINFLVKSRPNESTTKDEVLKLKAEIKELVTVCNEFKEVFWKKGCYIKDESKYVDWIKKDIPILPFEETIEFRRIMAYDALEDILKREKNTVLDFVEDLLIDKLDKDTAISLLDGVLQTLGYQKRRIPVKKEKEPVA